MSDNYILEYVKIMGDTLLSQNEFKFKPGLNIITGFYGTGKTTILNIISLLINIDRKFAQLYFFDNIEYKIKLQEKKSVEYSISKSIHVDIEGTKEKIYDLIPSSLQLYELIKEKIKIVLINDDTIFDYIFNDEIYKTLSLGERCIPVILELIKGISNSIILIDDVFAVLESEKKYLLFRHLMSLSNNNQIFLTLSHRDIQDLRNYLVHRDSEVLDYLRQSQVLDLRGSWQKTIIDYFKEEPVADYLAEFKKGINNIRSIVALQVKDDEIRNVLNRIMYANVITVMETYLSECFTRMILDNENNKLKLIETSPDFYKLSLSPREAYDWLKELDAKIIENVQGIVFHNLNKVISMFKSVLGVEFIDMGNIARAIEKRHDIIHRNGKSKDGDILIIDEKDILKLIENVELLIENIEKQTKS